MNTLQAITKRRSIRKFTNQPLSQQQIETLLNAAMLAPTAIAKSGILWSCATAMYLIN